MRTAADLSMRRGLNPWLVFLLVSGLVSALLWTFLFPVIETVRGFWSSLPHVDDWRETVRFRPIWKVWGKTVAKGWFTAEAVVAVLLGLWAGLIANESRLAGEPSGGGRPASPSA